MGQNGELFSVANKKIMIVDDDPDTCQMLSSVFYSRGYETIVAYRGKDAINIIRQEMPSVIILDIMMPDMDGWETYDSIRATSDVPVLFLSALSSGEHAARALGLGAKDYVQKPFHYDELIARTEALLKKTNPVPLSPYSREAGGTSQRPLVSVIIPTMNEAQNLPLIIPYFPLNWVDEIILVDGLSTDGTPEIAKRLLPSIKVVLEKKPGKGIALCAGYKAATGNILIVLDADGSHDPREIPRFVTALMEGADFAKGSRFAPGGGTTDMPRYRQLGNGTFVSIVNFLFTTKFTDLCYGYHAFWRYCLDVIDLTDVDGFEIDTAIYLAALRERLRIIEVPSFEGYRFYGYGKLRTIPDGLRVLRTIAREYYRGFDASTKTNYIGFRGKPIDGGTVQVKSPAQDVNFGHEVSSHPGKSSPNELNK